MRRRTVISTDQLSLFGAAAEVALRPRALPPADDSADAAARRAARELAVDLVLRAGAGTGKTHTLVDAAVHLVAGETALRRLVPPSRLLMLTFSEKAATELRERVRARFSALAVEPGAWGKVPWASHAAALSGAPITTFHGFAAGLLRRHAAAAGIDPAFEMLDEDQATQLLRTAAEEAVLAGLARPAVRELIRELEFARGDDAMVMGLVEHLAELVTRLREEGGLVDGVEIDDAAGAPARMAQAARDYGAGVDALLAALANAKTAGLRDRRAGLEEVKGELAATLVRLEVSRDPLDEPALRRVRALVKGSLGAEERQVAQRKIYEAERELRTAHVTFRVAPLAAELRLLARGTLERYQARKQTGRLDFSDLLLRARDVLGDAGVRADEQARWDAVLVDELQDTNHVQDAIVEGVRGPETRLLAVGDPKQSIYEFRGADVAVFEAVAARVGSERALTDSRRALAPLTHFVNRLFARAMPGGARGFEIAFDPARDALAPLRGGAGACVELLDGDPEQEHPLVGRRVRALVDAGTRYGDIAILLRRFTHLDDLLDGLRRAGVPHHVINGRGFYASQEVRDLAHALTLIDDPEDNLALLGVLRSPLVGLSDAALVALADLRGPRAPLTFAPIVETRGEVAGLTPGERRRLGEFIDLHARLRRHAERLGAAGVLRALVDATDLAAIIATTFDGEQRVANLERLIAVAQDHDEDGRAFVRRLRTQAAREKSLYAPAQVVDERDDVVRVMTIHQAKGLEFPVVFVPECGAIEREHGGAVLYDRDAGLGLRLRLDDGERMPSPRAAAAAELRRDRQRAESLRLFYVACTRARDLLVLSGTPGKGWRRAVDEWRAADAEAGSLLRVVPPLGLVARPDTTPPPVPVPDVEVARLTRALAPPRTGARAIIAPATQLFDFAACQRRYHLRHEIGLEEPVEGAGGDATRGIAAHRLLERLDFAAYRARGAAALAALAVAEGIDDEEIVTQIDAFLRTPFGEALLARDPATLRREVPFALAAGDDPRLLVKGQIDLVLLGAGAEPAAAPLTLLDYKFTRARREDAYAHRFQLLIYAAAARALYGETPRIGVVYLREAHPEPHFFPVDDARLDRLLEELAAGAIDLARARRLGDYAGRELAACEALGCGFVARCHPGATAPGDDPANEG